MRPRVEISRHVLTSESREELPVLPDLTVAENVTICRQWINPAPSKESKNAKGGDPSYLGRSVPRLLLPLLLS